MPQRPPSHQPWRATSQPSQAYDRHRGNSAERGYDRQWRKIRLARLRDEPLCRFCKAQGLVTSAVEVDHIDGNSRNNDPANLRPLCKPCHSRRTATEQIPRDRA